MKNRNRIFSMATAMILLFSLCSCDEYSHTVSNSDISSDTTSKIISSVEADDIFENIDVMDILPLGNGNFIIRKASDENNLLKYDAKSDDLSVIGSIDSSISSIKLIAGDTVAGINVTDSSKSTAICITDGSSMPLDEYYSQAKHNEYYAPTDAYLKEGNEFAIEKYDSHDIYVYPNNFGSYGYRNIETCPVVFTGKYLVAQYNTGVTMPATPEDPNPEYYLIAYDYTENKEIKLMQSNNVFTFSLIDENTIIVTEGTETETFIITCDGKTKYSLENAIRFSTLTPDIYFIKDNILYYASNPLPVNEDNVSASISKYDMIAHTNEVIYTANKPISHIAMLDNGKIIASADEALIDIENDKVIDESAEKFFVFANKVIVKRGNKISIIEPV